MAGQSASGPNPVLVVRDNLPGHIAELEAECAKLVARLTEINHEIALARTLLAVAPTPDPKT